MDNSRKGSSDRPNGPDNRRNDSRNGDSRNNNFRNSRDNRDSRNSDSRNSDSRNSDSRNVNSRPRGDDNRPNFRSNDSRAGDSRNRDNRGDGPRQDGGGYRSERPYNPGRNRPEGNDQARPRNGGSRPSGPRPDGGYDRNQRPGGQGAPRPGGPSSGRPHPDGPRPGGGQRPGYNPNRTGFDQARQTPFLDPDDSKAWQKRDEEGRQYGDGDKPVRRERSSIKGKKGPSPKRFDDGGNSGKGRPGAGNAKAPRRDRTEKYGKARGWQDFSDDDGRAKPSHKNTSPEKRRDSRPGGRPDRTTDSKRKGVPEYKNMAQPPAYDFLKKRGKAISEKNPSAEPTDSNEIRLNRYIAKAGVTSRREADELIAQGLVKVNGVVVTELGTKVMRTDTVTYEGKKLNPERLVYVLLNKPKDFITTTDDPENRRTVMDLVANACEERIYPVGRLDRNTTGLLLLTNDGELAKKLSHPSHQVKKVYHVLLDKPLTPEDYELIEQGLELEDGFAKVSDLAVLSPDRTAVGLEIHIGRNRIVRRIFEHLGYAVERLDRVTFAGLTKKDLDRGRWRYLSEKEVVRLKHFN